MPLITRYHAFLVAFFLGVFSCDPARTPASYEEDSLASAYYPTEYNITGNKDTTLVLVHGWNIDQHYWSHQVAAFSDAYTVLTMNLVTDELLQDSSRVWTAENFAQDIVKIIEREKLTNLILVGHSMAGAIVLAVQELVPDKTLAIVGVDCYKDVGFILTDQVQNSIDSFLVDFEQDYAGNVEQMVKTGLFENPTENQEAYQQVLHDYQSADPEVAIAIFRNLFPADTAIKGKIARLPFPVRTIISDYSPFNEEALRQYAKNGYRVKTITHSGHFPMIEQPEQFNQALREFLETIRSNTAR